MKFIICGPNVIESEEHTLNMAKSIKDIIKNYDIDFYFKTSFDKANRSSLNSYRGLGFEEGLRILKRVKDETGVKIATDIHESWQAKPVAEVADMIQIPAFLCRQTDLLKAAAETGKIIHVKKGQMCSAEQMHKCKEKIIAFGNPNVILCERGNSFGYQDLVVDPRNLIWLKSDTNMVSMDITHCLQKPSQKMEDGTVKSGGYRELIPYMGKMAVSLGVDGIFLEVHDDPDKALCDGPTQWSLDRLNWLMKFLGINFNPSTIKTDKISKHKYDKYYFENFKHLYDKKVRILEIGVQNCESLVLWEELFINAEYIGGISYGKNNDLKHKDKLNKTNLIYGDQSDKLFMDNLIEKFQHDKFDIIIDDGSHVPCHQFFTFESIFEKLLKENGIYIIEDVETSYWNKINPLPTIYGMYSIENSGIYNKGSLIEKFKSIPDVINRHFFNKNDYSIMEKNVDHHIKSITFSRNCIIISKKTKELVLEKNSYQHTDRHTGISSNRDLNESEITKLEETREDISGYNRLKKICIIYNFFNSDKDKNRLRNLNFFIDNAVLKNKNITCFIINRNNYPLKFKNNDNIKIIDFENKGICINGYKHGLNNVKINDYSYFCFLNDSMIGPFIEKNIFWADPFIKLLRNKNCVVGSYQQNNIPQTGFMFMKNSEAFILKEYLNQFNIITPNDALNLESKIVRHLIQKTGLKVDGTMKKGVRWTQEHSLEDVIFEKANRIGKNTSIFWENRKTKDLNYITEEILEKHIEKYL